PTLPDGAHGVRHMACAVQNLHIAATSDRSPLLDSVLDRSTCSSRRLAPVFGPPSVDPDSPGCLRRRCHLGTDCEVPILVEQLRPTCFHLPVGCFAASSPGLEDNNGAPGMIVASDGVLV